MIYTIGHGDTYEALMLETPGLRAGIDDPVWKDRRGAAANLAPYEGYQVYGVDADWDKDTRLPEDTWEPLVPITHRYLTREALLVKLPDIGGGDG